MRMADQDPATFWKERFPTEIPKAEEYISRLEDLIRWLAIPYAGRTPIFASVDIFTGLPLKTGPKLQETWTTVIGATGEPTPGVWKRCLGCGSWYVDSMEEPPENPSPMQRPWAYVTEDTPHAG